MKIAYADNHKWVKKISTDILTDLGSNAAKKIRKILNEIEQHEISHTIEPLDEAFITWFEPLYVKRINGKSNPNVYDIRATTLHRSHAKYPYHSLTLYEKGVPVGGTIFTIREDRVSLVYRAFQPTWSFPHRCSPALLAEYIITEYTQKLGKDTLVHGSDKNLYGVNSDIGMAVFKLSTGCHPELQKKYSVTEIDLSTFDSDVLVLELPQQGTRITTAYLYASEACAEKYAQLFKYEKDLHVIHVPRSI